MKERKEGRIAWRGDIDIEKDVSCEEGETWEEGE